MIYSSRRFGIVLLLAVYLPATTPLGELFKLPALIGHFQEHRQENPDMSVLGFIVLHYFSGSPRDADYERDMQLPFKTLEVSPGSLAATHFPPETIASIPFPSQPAFRKGLPPLALLSPPVPFLAMPAEPPEA